TASRAYWSENRHWPSPGPKPTDRIELVAERGTDPSPPLDAVGITGRDNGTAGKLGSAREHTPSTHHTPTAASPRTTHGSVGAVSRARHARCPRQDTGTNRTETARPRRRAHQRRVLADPPGPQPGGRSRRRIRAAGDLGHPR